MPILLFKNQHPQKLTVRNNRLYGKNGASKLFNIADEDEIQLPIKLPPDLTIVKEVVLVESPSVSPVKRGRGRPRKNPLPVDANTALLMPAALSNTPVRPIILQSASAPENIFPCSLCPRTFNSPFVSVLIN